MTEAEQGHESVSDDTNTSSIDLEVIRDAKQNAEWIDANLDVWQQETGITLDREVSEFGYPVIDLRDQAPIVAMDVLRQVGGSADVVYHGMHNNEFRRGAGMPDVTTLDALDPEFSHQPEGRKAVYATKLLEGGLAHAVLEHRPSDQDPETGETYAISMNRTPDGKILELSPQIASDLEAGVDRFTDGLLYILPASAFTDTPNSDHEVFAQDKVAPLAVVRVGASLGPVIVTPNSYSVRHGNEYQD